LNPAAALRRRSAIAYGAKYAATLALGQGHQLGIDDEEAAAKPNGARADRLADECECRGLRGGKRKQRSPECERAYNLTHTDLLGDYTNPTLYPFWRS
jgi:hypothetical protein